MKIKMLLSSLILIPVSSLAVISCSSNKTNLLEIFQNTEGLQVLDKESDGYKVSILQVNIFKEMTDEDFFIFQSVSSINSSTRYKKFVETFNKLTNIYKIQEGFWKPGMNFEYQVIENNNQERPYIIITYEKSVLNIGLNFTKPFVVFSSIFYKNEANEFFIDPNKEIKITEDKKEYELDIYKQDNYETLLKDWEKPEAKEQLITNLLILNNYIDDYSFNKGPEGFYNEWYLDLQENKIILTYQDYKLTLNLKINDIMQELAKFLVLEDEEQKVVFDQKASKWELFVNSNPNVEIKEFKLEDFAINVATKINDKLIEDSTVKLNDQNIANSIKDEYKQEIKIVYKESGELVIKLKSYSLSIVLKDNPEQE